MKLGEDNIS